MAVPGDVRRFVRDHDLTRADGVDSTMRATVSTAVYGTLLALALAVDHATTWVLFWAIGGLVLVGCFTAVHEAAHGSLYRNARLNDLAGVLWGLPVLHLHATYRPYHLQHHVFTNTDGDTEPLDLPHSRAGVVGTALVAGLGLNVILLGQAVRTVVGRPPDFARRRSRRGLALLDLAALVAFMVGTRVLAGSWTAVAAVWGVPALIGTVVYGLTVKPEHHGCVRDTDDVFLNTRTVHSNPVARYVLWNAGYHMAHHLVPSVPGRRLPALQGRLDGRGEFVERSYSGFYRAVLRDPTRWQRPEGSLRAGGR